MNWSLFWNDPSSNKIQFCLITCLEFYLLSFRQIFEIDSSHRNTDKKVFDGFLKMPISDSLTSWFLHDAFWRSDYNENLKIVQDTNHLIFTFWITCKCKQIWNHIAIIIKCIFQRLLFAPWSYLLKRFWNIQSMNLSEYLANQRSVFSVSN